MRILQLNVWARYGPYETREPQLKRLFADLGPDLVAMEMSWTPGHEAEREEKVVELDRWLCELVAQGGDDSPGFTFTSDSPYVQPFMEAVFAQPVHHRRIDYVFVGSPIRWKPRLIVTSARVVGQYADGGAPSDHYGVLADLELDGDRVGSGRGLDGWDEAKRDLGCA